MLIKNLNNRFKKVKEKKEPDILMRCDKCDSTIFVEDIDKLNKTCPNCGGYFVMNARERIAQVVDEGSFVEYFEERRIKNPLNFPGYAEKQKALRHKLDTDEAVVCGTAEIDKMKVAIAAMDPTFMMGSMGATVGEKITKTIELSIKKKLPLIIFSASGGARMQEGLFSLMQMAKTSQAIAKHNSYGLLYISVMTHPTTGGVSASFASLGDIILAEKGALIGFAGPRVIRQVTGTELPEGFQRADFLYEHGLVDKVVSREDMKSTISKILYVSSRAKRRGIKW